MAGAALNGVTVLSLPGLPIAVHPFVLGYEPLAESVSIRGGAPDRFLLEPVTAAAVEYSSREWVLLDTGFNVAVVRDPQRRAAHFNYENYTAVVPPGDPLADSVAAAGLDWSALRGCAISHLHLDHSGGLRLVPDGTPILLQRREWEFAVGRAKLSHCYFRDDYASRDTDVRLLDGDAGIAPGIAAVATPGHTPGHQSFGIELGARRIVLACDAADLRANLDERRAPGWTVDPQDVAAAQRSVDRLADLDARPDVEVWPGHDPQWWVWQAPRVIHRASGTTIHPRRTS